MRPRSILISGAALIAALSLVFGGQQLARLFGPNANVIDLAGPILAVATALICIAVLDWARNLGRRGGVETGPEDDSEDGEPVRRTLAPPPDQDARVMGVVQTIRQLATGTEGTPAIIEQGIAAIAAFSDASRVDLWLVQDEGALRPAADYAEGSVVMRAGAALRAEDEAELRPLLEFRKPLEARGADDAKFLFPLMNGEGCFGALRVTVPTIAMVGGGEGLGERLARIVAEFGWAVGAPDAYDRAVLDPVTRLYTRRHFAHRLGEAASVSRRYGEPLSLLMLDIDNFKMLNASFGPRAVDKLLQAIAGLVMQNVRDADGVFRLGPDEFAVLLPSTGVERARAVGDRLRRLVREGRTPQDNGDPMIATVTVGVAEFDEDMRGIEPLITRVREAMDAARAGGNDRVAVWQAPAATPEAGPTL